MWIGSRAPECLSRVTVVVIRCCFHGSLLSLVEAWKVSSQCLMSCRLLVVSFRIFVFECTVLVRFVIAVILPRIVVYRYAVCCGWCTIPN